MNGNKGLNDLIKQGEGNSEENQRKLDEIDKMINANKDVEIKKSNLPILVVALLIIVVILIILTSVLDNKVSKKKTNHINIVEIR